MLEDFLERLEELPPWAKPVLAGLVISYGILLAAIFPFAILEDARNEILEQGPYFVKLAIRFIAAVTAGALLGGGAWFATKKLRAGDTFVGCVTSGWITAALYVAGIGLVLQQHTITTLFPHVKSVKLLVYTATFALIVGSMLGMGFKRPSERRSRRARQMRRRSY
jgi:hypothetical protein